MPVGRKDRQPNIKPGDPHVKRDIQLLREQIDEALDREEALQEQLDALRQDADDLNLKTDNALLEQDEEGARKIAAVLRQTEQQITMLEADITHHRQMTAALMDQVNILESQLAAAGRKQETESNVAPPAEPPPVEPPPVEPEARKPIIVQVEDTPSEPVDPTEPVIRVPIVVEISDETEETAIDPPEPSVAEKPPVPPANAPAPENTDLASRRARLARRDPPQEE